MVTGIAKDARRRVLLANAIATAHTLGIEVIAGGLAQKDDFATCVDISCDMVTGDYIHPPITDLTQAQGSFPHLAVRQEKHGGHSRSIDQRWIAQQLDMVPPLSVGTPLKTLYDRMAQSQDTAPIPVIEKDGRPIGLLLEKKFKNLAYSAYGRDLINNRGWGKSLRDFITRCPIAEAATPLDQLLATYSSSDDSPGIIITNNGSYGGFLSTASIIRALHERTLARAQDENPLTRLPGNALIGEYLNSCLTQPDRITLAYLDFDNFKPFNDIYGFRQGDRAILLFAKLLQDCEKQHGWFAGHIGGDDFFAGIPHATPPAAQALVAQLITSFTQDAESFYDAETRQRGFIQGHDRDGNMRQFPLLSASAVILSLPTGDKRLTTDDISALIAQHKKSSKQAANRMASIDLSVPGSDARNADCAASSPGLTLIASA